VEHGDAREIRVAPRPVVVAEPPRRGHDDPIHILGWRHPEMVSNTYVVIHSNLNGSRNHALGVAFLHQTRAPSPRVGVQSKSAGSSECVRSYCVSVRTEEPASSRGRYGLAFFQTPAMRCLVPILMKSFSTWTSSVTFGSGSPTSILTFFPSTDLTT
jgi:hypothetical protein